MVFGVVVRTILLFWTDSGQDGWGEWGVVRGEKSLRRVSYHTFKTRPSFI
jgi:hypothetical protein